MIRLNRTVHWLACCGFIACFCAPVVGDDPLRARNDAIIVRAIERMQGYDYSGNDHVQAAIARHIA